MKYFLLFILLPVGNNFCGNAQDLPNPPSNIQVLPVNSYIIAMDNANQLGANGLFNIKTYGLIVYLLNNNKRVRWVITSGKAKDGIDFTVASDQVRPAINVIPVSRTYRAGPFVIFAADTSGICALVDAFCKTNGLAGNNRIKVYRNTLPVNVDIRYDLTSFKPFGAVLNDGGNDTIHFNYMIAASIPTSNYSISNGSNLAGGCYTFASEPHNTNKGAAVDFAITSIKKFVLAGGNFLAQCAADSNYENNPLGRFQTTTGMNVTNSNIGNNLAYPNPDLSFSQFEGPFLGYDGASFVQNWTITGSAINNENDHTKGTNAFSANIAASEAKLKTGIGGLVFYIGIHSFNNDTLRAFFPTQMNNGIRMYMNAFLTPAFLVCKNLAVRFINFTGSVKGSLSQLQWTVEQNESINYLDVEESRDGINFIQAGKIMASSNAGPETYNFSMQDAWKGDRYFRIKLVDRNKNLAYSNVIIVRSDNALQNNRIALVENPVTNSLRFIYSAAVDQKTAISIYNGQGQKVYSSSLYCHAGSNPVSLDIQLAGGMYFMEANGMNERSRAKFIKN